MSATTYVILEASDLPNVEFNTIMEASAAALRYSLDKSEFIVKYRGDKPGWLDGKTTYTHAQILEIVNSPEWTPPEP